MKKDIRIKTTFLGLCVAALIAINSCKKNASTTNVIVQTPETGLTVTESGEVQLNGKTYRGIGVNYFDAFYRVILKAADTTRYKIGLKYLSDNKIPFIRFAANGFWPDDWNLYRNNPDLYFKYMDRFVAIADSLHIGLIPSLFFNASAVSDIQKEGYGQWGVSTSKTMDLMRSYTKDMMLRYKDSHAIWGWEFGNEMNAYVDLYEQSSNKLFLPPVNTAAGTPKERVAAKDSLTTKMLIVAVTEFANTVKQYDKKHMIFTGNAMPEWNMWHRYTDSSLAKRWIKDQAADFGKILDAQNPAAVGTITVHFYHASTNENNGGRFTTNDNTMMVQAMATSTSLKRPLFVGEFGSPATDKVTEQAWYDSMLNAIVANKVPLSAMWVFNFPAQGDSFNVNFPGAVLPETPLRYYQLQEIFDVNRRWKFELGY